MRFKINKKIKNICKSVLLIFLCFSVCSPLVSFEKAEAATIESQLSEKQKELKRLENLLSNAKAEKAEILKKLKETEGKLTSLLSEKTKLEVSIGYSEAEIELIEKLIDAYEGQLLEFSKNLEEAEKLKEDKVSQLCFILKYIYENKNISSLELFFSSETFSEYVSKKEYAKNILSYQKNIVEEIEKTEEENRLIKNEYEEAKASLEGYKKTVEDKKNSVADDYKKLDSLIVDYQSALELTEEELDAIDSVEKEYASEVSNVKIDIEELMEYLSKQFRWPLYESQRYYISSYFGNRNDPFSTSREHHNGVDIVVPKGTPILASAGGVVTRSEYASVFGNVVVISHGNGLQTLYCHCSQRKVSVGDKVKQGEVIALVGSTGRSTGPHLHFSFILNGSYVNPEKYVDKGYFR